MRVLRGFRELEAEWTDAVVTIGNFDGVHRGHQEVVRNAVDGARRRDSPAVVCTFHPHTLAVLEPERAPEMLQTLDQRLDCIAELDVDATVVIPFDQRVAAVPREEFLHDFLLGRLRTRELHLSEGFSFGRDSKGNVEYLKGMAPAAGFELEVVPALRRAGRRISSTWVRQAVAEGDVELAAELLGRPFAVIGTVVEGAGRGRRLDAPTANLQPDEQIRPGTGVYVTDARFRSSRWASVTNVGHRPTFEDDEESVIEAHLLDFDEDLYDERIELAFLARLRDELEFEGPDELMAQIRRDVRAARRYFSAHRPSV